MTIVSQLKASIVTIAAALVLSGSASAQGVLTVRRRSQRARSSNAVRMGTASPRPS